MHACMHAVRVRHAEFMDGEVDRWAFIRLPMKKLCNTSKMRPRSSTDLVKSMMEAVQCLHCLFDSSV